MDGERFGGDAMDGLGLVGIGASAGGLEALTSLVGGLDPAMPAAVLVVVHQAADGPSVLAGILDRRCPLDVVVADDGVRLEAGRVYVAPPNAHLLLDDGHAVLSRGPKENGHRPGIDPLFRSLALVGGPRVTGVVLSGLLDDGAAGLLDIVRHGGAAVVQEPGDAMYDSMPSAALEQVPGAVVRPARAIGAVLAELASRRPLEGHRPSGRLAYEVDVSRGRERAIVGAEPPGPAAGLACPDCSGPLFDLGSDDLPRFRCRVGHAWSPRSLSAEQDDAVEKALYAALRALEDKMAMARRVADSADASGAQRVAQRSRASASEALRAATVLRAVLAGNDPRRVDGHDDEARDGAHGTAGDVAGDGSGEQ